jgi:FixJ family two-component response regulator
LDVHLPRLSGIELTGLLARLGVNVPIVFITADQELAESLEMRQTGRPCLLKPIDDDMLVRAISSATEHQARP